MQTLEANQSAAASLNEALKGSGHGLSSSNSLDFLVKVAGFRVQCGVIGRTEEEKK